MISNNPAVIGLAALKLMRETEADNLFVGFDLLEQRDLIPVQLYQDTMETIRLFAERRGNFTVLEHNGRIVPFPVLEDYIAANLYLLIHVVEYVQKGKPKSEFKRSISSMLFSHRFSLAYLNSLQVEVDGLNLEYQMEKLA